MRFRKKICFAAFGSLVLILSGITIWKASDYRMPATWFELITQRGYQSFPGKLEIWRLFLIKRQWANEAKNLNLVGRWRSQGCRDGEFICEFTEDGKFFIFPEQEHSRTAVLWLPLNGCSYERFLDGYSVPAGRFGGDPFRENGVAFGVSFAIHEENNQFTSGWIATDGKMVEVTFDSIQYCIVYETMLLERLTDAQVSAHQSTIRPDSKSE